MSAMVQATPTNLWVLRRVFDGRASVPNAVSGSDAHHIRRCIAAGLVAADPASLTLTDAGRVAVPGSTPVIVKRCHCRAVYTREDWAKLTLVGPLRMGDEVFEQRNCPCGNTLGVLVEKKLSEGSGS